MLYRGYFKCPKCNGNIIKNYKNNKNPFKTAICEDCESEYYIIIDQSDLTYIIRDSNEELDRIYK